MLLGGLWHGAAWTFVVWGGLHGLSPGSATRWLQRAFRKDRGRGRVTRGGQASPAGGDSARSTLVCIGWVFFRAQTSFDGQAPGPWLGHHRRRLSYVRSRTLSRRCGSSSSFAVAGRVPLDSMRSMGAGDGRSPEFAAAPRVVVQVGSTCVWGGHRCCWPAPEGSAVNAVHLLPVLVSES